MKYFFFIIVTLLLLNNNLMAQYELNKRTEFLNYLIREKKFDLFLLEINNIKSDIVKLNDTVLSNIFYACYKQKEFEELNNYPSLLDLICDSVLHVKSELVMFAGNKSNISLLKDTNELIIFVSLVKNLENSKNFTPQEFNDSIIKLSYDSVYFIAKKYLNKKRKSPLLAGILSTLIPGLGKVYIEKPKEGIFPFLKCMVTSGIATEGFLYNGLASPQLYIFGSVFLFFYTSNIYGSVTDAKQYNINKDLKFNKELESQIENIIDYAFGFNQ